MGIELIEVDISEVCIALRDKERQIPSFNSLIALESSKIAVSSDTEGHYNISPAMFYGAGHYEFYDQDQKILDWYIDDEGQMRIQAHTSKQINVLVDINANTCQIKAKGPLLLEGKLLITTELNINAETLCFAESIVCDGTISLAIQQGVGFLGEVSAKHCGIEAAFIQQSADFHIQDDLDMTTQIFKQQSQSKTITGSLNLLATQSEIAGDLTVTNQCFIASNTMFFGDQKTESTIKLLGKNHIHFGYMSVQGDTQITIGDLENTAASSFIVDRQLILDKSSKIYLTDSHLSAGSIMNMGELSVQHGLCEVNDMQQNGIFDSTHSKISIYERFAQGKHSLTEFKNTDFVCPEVSAVGGQFIFDQCDYTGQNINLFSGLIEVKNKCKISISELMLFDENTRCTIYDSQINVALRAQFLGETHIQQTDIQAASIHAIENKTTINNSNLRATYDLNLNRGADISLSKLTGKMVKLSGTLNLNDVEIYSKYIDILTEQAEITELYADCHSLELQGSLTAEQVVFKKCSLTTKRLSSRAHITVDTSVIYGIGERDVRHNLQNGLRIHRSKFVTEGVINLQNQGQLDLDGYSTLRSGNIYSQGSINANNGTIVCDSLHQNQANLTLQSSQITARNGIYSRASQLTLNQNALLMTTTVRQAEGSLLSANANSTVLANQSIITDATSTISGHASTIVTKKFVARGRTDLCNSLLSAEELLIFNQFDAKQKSRVVVDGLMAVAKDAHVTLDDTQVAAHDVHNFGAVTVNNSIVAAKNSLASWSSSTLNLQGITKLAAENMVLAGAVTTSASPNTAPVPDDKKIPVQIIAKQKLTLTKEAKVTGDANLAIQVNEMKNWGTVDLSATFQAVGNQFTNYNSINADTIHLGFDDYAINWSELSAKKMTIHSNFVNVLGGVFVKESFSCAGFYGLNFGLIAANNYSNSTLFSLNSGLVTPNFSGDAAYIFSLKNLPNVAKIIASMTLPTYTNAINLVFMLPALGRTGYQMYDAYAKFDCEKLQNMHIHEWMPLLGQVKDTAMFAWGACNTAYTSTSELSSLSSDFTEFSKKAWDFDNYSSSQFLATAADINWQRVCSAVGTTFLGSYTDSSLLHLNVGGSFAASTQKNSLLTINTGIEASLLAHTINTHYLFNEGLSVGGEAAFLASNIYNTGSMEGTRRLTILTDTMTNTASGVVEGTKVNVSINKLDQEGHLELHSGQAKIGELHDTNNATTQFTDLLVTGDNFHEDGHLEATNVQFKYTGEVVIPSGATAKTDNVAIEADKFSDAGNLDYQHTLFVKANEAYLVQGSVVNGAKTAEDQLFVPKSDPAEAPAEVPANVSNNDTPASPPKEPEKEFKPQHVFVIEAKHVELKGQISGGDYTTIQGKLVEPTTTDASTSEAAQSSPEVVKCETLVIGDSANIDLKRGSIASQDAAISGRTHLDGFNLDIGHSDVSQTADCSIANSVIAGNSLKSTGTFNLDHCSIKIAHIDLGQEAKEHITDSTIQATDVRDLSQMEYQGQVAILTDNYEHGGTITHGVPLGAAEDKNLFYVQAKSADLHGAANFDNAFFDIEHFNNGVDFVAGRGIYSQYRASDSFGFETLDSFHLNGPISRACDLTIKSNDISIQVDSNLAHHLNLISTVGDVSLLSNISTDSLYVQSARNIWMNHNVYANSVANFEASGGFYNLGGSLNADTVAVKASEVKNISAGSPAASWSWGNTMGSTGIINGRTNTYLEATQGNIENHGGIIRAGEYTQLVAHGNVINNCNIRSIQGAYDVIQKFDAGLIAGGNGTKTNGFGLYVKADGKVISDASDFVSNGANYIEADQGFSLNARQETHVSDRWTTKNMFGHKKHHEETTTTVKGTIVQSATGVNIFKTEHGGLSAVAAKFVSPGGTEIAARDNVQLFSLKSTNTTNHSSSHLWGLFKHSSSHKDQSSTPTLFWDNGITRVSSSEGSIDARGAYFVGAGDLYMKAKGRIKFGLDVLDHEAHEKRQSIGISVPGLSAAQAWKHSGNVMDAVTAEDATVAKLDSMLNSGNSTELLANTANLGINLYNTTNSAMRGLANGTLSDELMARYGLGGAKGFSPAITLSMTKTDSKTKYQTLSQGGVNRGGNIVLEAGEGIDLENGVRVHADGNMDVNAPEILASAAALHSSSRQTTTTESISVNLSADIQDAGVSYSKNSTQATHQVYAELSAGRNVKLHHQDGAMHRVELNGARIQGQTMDGDLDILVITDRQDTMSNQVESASASLSGQVSAYKGQGTQTITNQHSGIHVVDGINTNGHNVHVTEAVMHGGAITSDGKNAIVIDTLVADKIVDEQHYTGVGISLNVNDLQRMAGGQPSNEAGEQAIAIAEVSMDHVNRRVEQTPVIFGAQGSDAVINNLSGEIHTRSTNGSHTVHDKQMHLKLDLPVTNHAYLAQSSENIHAGMDVIAAALARPNPTDESHPVRHDEFALPSRREDDELQQSEGDQTDRPDRLPPEVLKEIAKKTADLTYVSPELKRKIANDTALIKASERRTGKADPKAVHRLQENYKLALWQTAKAYAEGAWGAFSSNLGPEYNRKLRQLLSEPGGVSRIGVKSCMGLKGAGITFMFNLGLAYTDSSVDRKHLMKKAVKDTAKDGLISIGIKFIFREAAGSIGLIYTVGGVWDTLTYDERFVGNLFEQSATSRQRSNTFFQSGNYKNGFASEYQAVVQFDAASRALAFHCLFSGDEACFSNKPRSSIPPVPVQFKP